jgi:RHS repeat-associated protein
MRESSTLNYLLTDHLGSTSKTIDSISKRVLTEVRYKAWGEERYNSGAPPTSLSFSGQRAEAGLGLYFYKARYLDPVLGRFTSPDSIVPNPGNPLDWDRFSYVRNNPLRYVDPSGHEPCFEDGYWIEGAYSEEDHLQYLALKFGLKFKGNNWTNQQKWALILSVQSVANKLSEVLSIDTVTAFQSVFGITYKDSFIFENGCSECSGFALTISTRHIKFRDFYKNLLNNVTLGIHELGHDLENAMEITLQNGTKFKAARSYLPASHVSSRDGLLPPVMYQQNTAPLPGEVFADTFIAYVFDKWDTVNFPVMSLSRYNWMNQYLPGFLNTAINNHRERR